MKNIFLTLSFLFFFCFIRSQDLNEKLIIIDGIVLGETKEMYTKRLQEFQIPNRDFYSLCSLLDSDDKNEKENKMNFYYTNLFNYTEFSIPAKKIEHPSLLLPDFLNNKNLTSLTILLGHTNLVFNPKNNEIHFRQDIVLDILEKIIELYRSKYGDPMILISKTVEPPHLSRGTISKEKFFSSDYTSYIWKTDLFDITIFTGVDLSAYYFPKYSYSASTNMLYSNLFGAEVFEDTRLKNCSSLSYIKYELNKKGLEMIFNNSKF